MSEFEGLVITSLEVFNELRSSFGRLQALKELTIKYLELTTLHDIFANLSSLEKLVLWDLHELTELCSSFGGLKALKELTVERCSLTKLPDGFENLSSLEKLQLSSLTELTELCSSFGGLKSLKELTINVCSLTKLPDGFENLSSLCSLKLTNCDLEEFPKCILNMKNLQDVDLSNADVFLLYPKRRNRIKQLPMELAFTNLLSLKLTGNPIEELPKEIWEQGIGAIKSFMLAILPGGEPLSSDTVNMLGDTGAGKTSLAQSLIARTPHPTKEDDRTRVLQQLRMTIDNALRTVTINDFGGHQIYHSVLPIFLPKNGLLMLVFDLTATIEEREQSLKKWLFTAIAMCAKIRVILVGTHADKLKTPSERSSLREQMKKLSEDVLKLASEEVESHKNHVMSWPDDYNQKQKKITDLELLLSNIPRPQDIIGHVILSCTVRDDELLSLHTLVLENMLEPRAFPVLWCRIIGKILNFNPSRFYITFPEVQNIAKEHFKEKDDDQALITILHFLSKMSLILWIDTHQRLKKFIFHMPQKMIDACKEVLHHDSKSLPQLHKKHWDDYEQGIVREPLLRDVVGKVIRDNSQEERPATELTFEDIVDFLEEFNIISQIARHSTGKQFYIPCKLPAIVPSEMEEFKFAAERSQHRVAVRLSFLGSMVPLSYFETSLSAMLKVATQWSPPVLCPWKNGLIVFRDKVYFVAELCKGNVTLTAVCDESVDRLWTILQPMLECLNKSIVEWHGAPPKCSVECPLCDKRCQARDPQSKVGEIEIDLRQLALVEQEDDTEFLRCPLCKHWIERNLCLPSASRGQKRPKHTESKVPLKKRSVQNASRSVLSGATQEAATRSMHSRESDFLNKGQLREQFQKSYYYLMPKLSFPEVTQITNKLFSKFMLLPSERELVLLEGKTPTQAAQTLLDIIGKKDEKVYDTFLEILEKDLNRGELVKQLTTFIP